LRVLSLNLWNENHWFERRDEVVAWMELLEPDVVGLQEVVQSDALDQADWLAERTGMYVAFGGSSKPDGSQFGNAILSRFPITASDQLELTLVGHDIEPRFALRCVLDAPGGPINVYTTHLSHLFNHGFIREAQVVQLADWIDTHPPAAFPTIVTGDFNAQPDSAEIRFMKGLQSLAGRSFHLFDAYEVAGGAAPTWDNANPWAATNMVPDQRIDYVFVGVRDPLGAGRVLSARLAGDQPLGTVFASDHFGVLAELAWPSGSWLPD